MQKQFEAHGNIEVRLQGQILEVEATGPWNLEALEVSSEQAKPLLEKLEGGIWSVLSIMHGECIFVHSASQRLTEIVRQEKVHGRVATAILVNDCDSPNFAKQHLSEIYQKAGEAIEFFDDLELARQWLTERMTDA